MKLYQLKFRVKAKLHEHFSLWITLLAFSWLFISHSLTKIIPILGMVSCLPLYVACALYYYFYVKSYLKLKDAHSFKEYYYDLYRFFGVIVFCIFTILLFGVFGIALSQSFEFTVGFESTTLLTMVLLSLKSVIDSILLGFITAMNFSPVDFKVTTYFGKFYLYLLQVLVDVVIISLAFKKFKSWIGTKKAIKKIQGGDHNAIAEFNQIDKSKLTSLLNAISNSTNESELLDFLKALSNSKSEESIEVHLTYLQKDFRPEIIKHCHRYLTKVKKWQLDKALKKMRPAQKKRIFSAIK